MGKKWLLFFGLISFGCAYGQNPIGLPNIISYSRNDYNAGLQNRGIAQDKNGILYFANSEGLLSFDGTYWKLYPLPNKTIVRSVAVGTDDKIYVGGQNEMGYFAPDKNGILVYTTLKTLLPYAISATKDIWNIVSYRGQMFFRSQGHIFIFDEKKLTHYEPVSQWQFLAACNNRLFAQDGKNGLYEFIKGKWSPVKINNAYPKSLSITSMLALNRDSILIATLKNGIFILSNQKLSVFNFIGGNPFENQLLLCARLMDDHTIAIGTQMSGLYIIDEKGRVIENLTRKEGLQNNTVLALFSDKDHNLWMGLDDGVDYNAYNTAIKHIYPEKLNEGTGYSARLFNHTLYIGTSNWLYALPVDSSKDLSTVKGTFKPVENTKGPAWGLFDIDNNLLLAHHDGAFLVKGDKAIPINTSFGYWGFTPENNRSSSNTLFAGNYEGIDVIRHSAHSFTSEGNIKFNESARYVIIENGIAWVSHNYKGIFKIDLHSPANPATRLYTEKDGLPSDLKNRLFTIKNRMVAATEKGIYEYNAKTDRFEPSAYFKPVFQQKDLRYLREDSRGNIWFIEGKALGVVDYSGTSPRLIYFPELTGQLVSDFENIYPLDEENIFVGAEKGFYHINYRQYKTSKSPVSVLVRLVKASGDADRILNGGYSSSQGSAINQLSSQQNSLHFEYSAPSYQKQSNIAYSHFLRGFDKEWSGWSNRTEKDYTNLPHGHYTFQVRARGNLGDKSAITSYSFIVLPPWYKTSWAYVFYGFLFMAFNYLFYRLLQRKFAKQRQIYKEEEKRLKYLHQLEMDRSEKEIIALKNEKLESEILGKNSELAAVAMNLLQKGELLAKIKEELVQLRKDTNDLPSEELKKLIRILNQESKVDKDWEQFVTYFDNTHSDFLRTLKKTHPLLSPHELKLCAYLRMNLSSKEIAQLLNISVRGVEISRYRLRKKLKLPTEVNLYNYFTDFSMSEKEKTA